MSKRQGDEQVKVLIQTVALERPRFGYRRIHFMLKKGALRLTIRSFLDFIRKWD
ncbi:hypothetical protein [Candidatus Protochlamydia sp. W-9]|uniref:hypothetical protein n=1 Tax=Candidatus Protochlamydia sp. W-9 TaxID=1785087 RepID=UPI001300EBE5|nr:hypothetical protein [Candidatus Protochlamydia sp. W-9]